MASTTAIHHDDLSGDVAAHALVGKKLEGTSAILGYPRAIFRMLPEVCL
jgi:hypothetical protein